jgi:error-prone DNA polymerase
VLTAIRLGTPVDRIGFAADRNGERCLKSAEEMARLFAAYPEALDNTIRVLDACSGFSLDQLHHEYPDEILEPGVDPTVVSPAAKLGPISPTNWPHGHYWPRSRQIELRAAQSNPFNLSRSLIQSSAAVRNKAIR